jgi:hypothetical protein
MKLKLLFNDAKQSCYLIFAQSLTELISLRTNELFDTFDTQNCFLTAVVTSSNFKSNHKSELGRIRGSLPLITEIRVDYMSAAPT